MNWNFYKLITLFLFVVSNVSAQEIITDGDLVGGQTYSWTKDKVYVLDGFVYLEEGGVLNIEEGTTIYGREITSTGEPAALIITRGAQIFANGTEAEPIVFTAESVYNGSIQPDQTVNGLWGGLVILGNGTVARPNCVDFIEGIPDEPRTAFGGCTSDTESSGALTYVSIRHGGAELSAGNEINGLTLGAVGSGTLIDYVEVFANADDGIEWFGGTVNVKHAISAFCGDDGMDYDFGWRGNGQYWFVIQRSDAGGNGGEHDGAQPDELAPFSRPTIFNATYIGSGSQSSNVDNEFGLLMRDNAGGTYANSIFADFADMALSIEDLPGGGDSHANLLNGDLSFTNNYWWAFGAGADITDIIDTYSNGTDPDASDVIDHLTSNSNLISNPMICGIDRVVNGGLNPRLNAGSPALTGGTTPPNTFFDNVTYHGAFDGSTNWASNWTALDQYNFMSESCATNTNDPFAQNNGFILNQNTPNPATDFTTFQFTTPSRANVLIEVYDLNGRLLSTIANGNYLEGNHSVDLNVSNFANGTYFVTMKSDSVVLTRKMTVLK